MPKTDEALFLRIPPVLKLAIGAAASIDDRSINDLCTSILATYAAERATSDREYARLLFDVGVNNTCPER
jgi:hypothetical protein